MDHASVYGVAIVGTGMIAEFHAQALRDVPEARLVAVCSRSMERASGFVQKFGGRAYDRTEALMADPAVDIVMIATPSGTHMEAAVAAARAGKHVLCEKPLDITLPRVDAMIAAHHQAGTRLGGIFQMRYMPALEPVRKALKTGRFGTLTYAGAYVPWWRSDAYYTESSWHGTLKGDGGGALMNQAIHMIDLLCDLMPPVQTVTGYAATVGHPGIETEDVAAAALRFEGGAAGIVYGSTSAWPGQPKRLEISGTRGSIVLQDDRLTLFEFQDKQPEDEDVRQQCSEGVPAAHGHGVSNPAAMTPVLHTACIHDFVTALRDGRTFGTSGESARRSIALIHAIYRASHDGIRVSLQ